MESISPLLCKVCQGIFQEGHRRRQTAEYLIPRRTASDGQARNADDRIVFSQNRRIVIYMHYPNLAVLQKSAEKGGCQLCRVLLDSLRNARAFESTFAESQALEAQRLQTLGDRAFSATGFDGDEDDKTLDAALQMKFTVTGQTMANLQSISPREHGEGRLLIVLQEVELDHPFLQRMDLKVFKSTTGDISARLPFLSSPGGY